MTTYYNEFDPCAAAWLRELIKAGLIPAGDVDERSITDVQPGDIAGYTQCHFFAGIGGWPIAARLAGWPDDRPLWTGSPPCQPFSVAGKGKAQSDERHLWPDLFRLVRSCRPAVLMGEQVAAAVGKAWLDGVSSDMEGIGYTLRALVAPACAVNAPHRRDRLWFVAGGRVVGIPNSVRGKAGLSGQDTREKRIAGIADNPSRNSSLADSNKHGRQPWNGNSPTTRHWHPVASARSSGHWDTARWLISAHDGKARRVEPSIPLLVDGLPNRAPLLRGYGNAIVPAIAAEVIGAWMDGD